MTAPHFTEDTYENGGVESIGLNVAPPQRHPLKLMTALVWEKGLWKSETGSSKEISRLKALNQMTSAIIGDTQHTGKQEEAF